MELIFESVGERDEFFRKGPCPSKCGGKNVIFPHCHVDRCAKCWEQSGVKYSVKEKKQEYDNITITQRLYRIRSLYTSAKRLDPDFREDDYVWIIGEDLIDHLANTGYEYRSAGDKYKSLAGICITTCHDYPLRVVLAKKNLENVGPTPDYPVPIEEQKGCYTEIVINEPLRPGDRLVKKDGKFYVEKRPEPEMHIVMPRHCGRTAAYAMVDEMHRLSKLDHQFYNNKNWKEALEVFMDKHDRIKKPEIEKVIFNDPATIVFWKDGTKTVVKVQEGDEFDPEKGLAMAICKKVYGNDSRYFEEFKKWLPKESASKRLYTVGKLVSEAMNESMRRATESLKNLEKELDDIATVKRCGTCTYEVLWKEEEPCRSCVGRPEPSNWKPKSSEPLKPCEECKHEDVHEFHEPCRSCSGSSKFEEKEVEKLCCNCQWYDEKHDLHRPCAGCVEIDFGNWKVLHKHFEPKDAK